MCLNANEKFQAHTTAINSDFFHVNISNIQKCQKNSSHTKNAKINNISSSNKNKLKKNVQIGTNKDSKVTIKYYKNQRLLKTKNSNFIQFSFLKYIYLFFFIFPVLFLQVYGIQGPEGGFYKREHSLVKPYAPAGGTIPFFELTGDTMVTNSFIRLTSDDKSRSGGLWNKIPCYQRAWEIHITFKISGASRNLAADGLAFWYTEKKLSQGTVFGGSDHYKGLAIILDTYKNGANSGAFPRISGIVNDGTNSFDHSNDGEKQSFGHCYGMLRNREYETQLRIHYKEKVLTVDTNVDNSGKWRNCFKKEGVILPTGYYFGFTAATGDLSDNHDVISIRTYQIETTDTLNDISWRNEVPRIDNFIMDDTVDRNDANSGEGTSKKFWVLLIIAIGIICTVGYVVMQKREEANRKRFY